MLKIKDRQMDALGRHMDQRLLNRLAMLLADQLPPPAPGAAADPAAHEPLLRDIVTRADDMGLDQEPDLVAYAVLALQARPLCGHDAAMLNWMRSTLEMDDVSGSGRIFLVLDGLRELAPTRPHAGALRERVAKVQGALA